MLHTFCNGSCISVFCFVSSREERWLDEQQKAVDALTAKLDELNNQAANISQSRYLIKKLKKVLFEVLNSSLTGYLQFI